MQVSTYVDAVGALAAWINSRTGTLVGAGRPLQKGAHFKHLGGAAPAVYVLVEALPSRPSDGNAEDPDMLAQLSLQVCGGNMESATIAATALANELITELNGRPRVAAGATLQVADDMQGPYWSPVGDLPRLIITATVRMQPA